MFCPFQQYGVCVCARVRVLLARMFVQCTYIYSVFFYLLTQSAWRGYYVRRYVRTRAIAEAHARLEAATAALTENKRLRSKVNRVLEVLLKGKYLSQIVEALHKLGESIVCAAS